LLGSGNQWGIRLRYAAQHHPGGVAQAFLVTERLIAGQPTGLMLGDNILFGTGLPDQLRRAAANADGATIFGYPVAHPEAFGVAKLDAEGRVVSLEEKPQQPQSNLAVPGLYFYDAEALPIAKSLRPSARGELEITDLNNAYLSRGKLKLSVIGRGSAWLDGGTPESLFEASQFVRIMEQRTGLKIACLEEVAYRMRYITLAALEADVAAMKQGSYRDYLESILHDEQPPRR
jgi:glucose-1-phosphate thymidylyltransferase